MRSSFIRILSAVAILAMSPLAAGAADTADAGAKVFELHAENGSHESGTVALIPDGSSKTRVIVSVVDAPDAAQPDHIHLGTCAKLDPAPKYPLSNVVNGVSETTVPVGISALMASPMAVNVHESTTDLKKYVACTDLTASK